MPGIFQGRLQKSQFSPTSTSSAQAAGLQLRGSILSQIIENLGKAMEVTISALEALASEATRKMMVDDSPRTSGGIRMRQFEENNRFYKIAKTWLSMRGVRQTWACQF